jgi:hypothetical protein
MDRVTTFNEANVRLLVDLMPGFQAAIPTVKAAIAAAAKATDSPRFSRLAYADPQIVPPIMLEAHRKAYDAIKAGAPRPARRPHPDHAGHPVGRELRGRDGSAPLYGDWVEVARTHADFFGVQTYTRFSRRARVRPPPAQGAELTLPATSSIPRPWPTRSAGRTGDRQADLCDRKRHRARTTTRVGSPSSTRRWTACGNAWTRASRCTAISTGRCWTISSGRPATACRSAWWPWTARRSSARPSPAPPPGPDRAGQQGLSPTRSSPGPPAPRTACRPA